MTEARKIVSRVELNLHPIDGAGVSSLRCTVGVKNADAILSALDAAGFTPPLPKRPNQAMMEVLYKARTEQIQPYEGVDCWAEHVIKKVVEAAAKETT